MGLIGGSQIKNIYEFLKRRMLQILDFSRRHKVKIIVVSIVLVLTVGGLIANAVVVRKAKVEDIDNRISKIHERVRNIRGDVKDTEQRFTKAKQTLNQLDEETVKLEEASAWQEKKIESNYKWTDEWNSKKSSSSNQSLVNKVNNLAREDNGLKDKQNAKAEEFVNLTGSVAFTEDEIDTLRAEAEDLRVTISSDMKKYQRRIKSADSKRSSLSIYSLSFNENFKDLKTVLENIKAKPIPENLEVLNDKIDSIDSKSAKLKKNIDQRNAVHNGIIKIQRRMDEIHSAMDKLWPR